MAAISSKCHIFYSAAYCIWCIAKVAHINGKEQVATSKVVHQSVGFQIEAAGKIKITQSWLVELVTTGRHLQPAARAKVLF